MYFYLMRIQLLIDQFRRDTDRRLRNQYITSGHGRKRRQFLADPFGKHGTPHDTVRNIGSKLHPSFHQLFLGEPQRKHTVHPVEHCRRIRAAARHPRRHRYMFIQGNLHAFLYSEFLHQHLCRLIGKIILIDRQIEQIRQYMDPRFFLLLDPDLVIEIDRLHDHTYVMIPILPPAQYIQTKIDLPQCLQLQLIHTFSPYPLLYAAFILYLVYNVLIVYSCFL